MAGWRAMLVLVATAVPAPAGDEFEKEPINYSAGTPDNVVSRLQKKLVAGAAKLDVHEERGYLDALLKALDVPASSQMLVFSKTSLQRNRISPRTPRALYFNDDVYIGYCQKGEVLEISAVDAKLGTVFYTLDQAISNGKPRFVRQTDTCLLCHGSSQTHGVPGHLVRSVFSDRAGLPILSAGTHRVDQTTAFDKRWGGWYVTGTHGKQTHLGNLVIKTREVPRPVENPAGQNVTDLGSRIDKGAYPSPHSDIVALMVLEHQAEAHNLLTRANFEGRQALHMEETLNREMKLPATYRWDSTMVRIRSVGDALLQYLVFSDEAPLTEKVQGTSSFAEEFGKRGPRDGKGRSLRDLDLERRFFKYPLSYLIYSESFDALPDRLRDYVLRRLWDVLSGKDTRGLGGVSPPTLPKPFAHLSSEDRTAIREILVATKSNLPAYWRAER